MLFYLVNPPVCLQLAAGRPTPVGVAFTARRVAQCSALLLLVARGQRSVGGATLAFKLQGVVTGAKSQVIIIVIVPKHCL